MKRSSFSLVRSLFTAFLLLISAFSLSAQSRGVSIRENADLNSAVGKQWAVFIAIDRYQEWGPLKNPVKDAKEIRDILLETYYVDEVHELYDQEATAAGIRQLLTGLASQVVKDDSVFIFYAGHGYLDTYSKTGFWIPSNGGRDLMAQANWIPNIQIRNLLDQLPAKHVFLISDSCFSGDILNANRGTPVQIDSAYYRQAYDKVSRQVMTSGASEEVPDASEFAVRLKSGLRRAEGACIDPEYLFTSAGVREVKSTQPMLGVIHNSEHQTGGSFLFFRKAGSAVVEAQPSSSTVQPTLQPTPSTVTEAIPEGLAFEVVDGKATVVKYIGSAQTVNIPSQYFGSPVTSIGDSAFSDCSSLTSVTIPSSVTSIGYRAFSWCSSLTNVTIPSSVTFIGMNAFACCKSLTSITADSRNPSYASVDGVLFDRALKTIVAFPAVRKGMYSIPSSVTSIGNYAFYFCSSLTSVTIPSSVTSIGYRAFYSCDSLTSVTIPASVTSIGNWAFDYCSSLSSVTLSRQTEVGEGAFPETARIIYSDSDVR
jgi:hypothetical protein